jgi:hypothetical protein
MFGVAIALAARRERSPCSTRSSRPRRRESARQVFTIPTRKRGQFRASFWFFTISTLCQTLEIAHNTANSMILVPLLNPKSQPLLQHDACELRVRGTRAGGARVPRPAKGSTVQGCRAWLADATSAWLTLVFLPQDRCQHPAGAGSPACSRADEVIK